jgi:hypothetical protein
MLLKWFTHVHLLDTYLAFFMKTFICRSLPISFLLSSTKWFVINTCISNTVGLLPSLWKLQTYTSSKLPSYMFACLRSTLSTQLFGVTPKVFREVSSRRVAGWHAMMNDVHIRQWNAIPLTFDDKVCAARPLVACYHRDARSRTQWNVFQLLRRRQTSHSSECKDSANRAKCKIKHDLFSFSNVKRNMPGSSYFSVTYEL